MENPGGVLVAARPDCVENQPSSACRRGRTTNSTGSSPRASTAPRNPHPLYRGRRARSSSFMYSASAAMAALHCALHCSHGPQVACWSGRPKQPDPTADSLGQVRTVPSAPSALLVGTRGGYRSRRNAPAPSHRLILDTMLRAIPQFRSWRLFEATQFFERALTGNAVADIVTDSCAPAG
jgi:hypothetical protein